MNLHLRMVVGTEDAHRVVMAALSQITSHGCHRSCHFVALLNLYRERGIDVHMPQHT